MVDDLKEYRVLNKTCYKAMEVAAKATATEKGLKGNCLREFVSKYMVVNFINTHEFRLQKLS